MPETKKSAPRAGSRSGWTDEERAAMQERAAELKKEKRGKASKADGLADLLEKVAEMPESDRIMAERIHTLVMEAAPDLQPRTWYGMPAYANQAGKVICFFTPAEKFKERYATFGFQADANLDDGSMWPTSFAIMELDDSAEAKITQLVKKAVR